MTPHKFSYDEDVYVAIILDGAKDSFGREIPKCQIGKEIDVQLTCIRENYRIMPGNRLINKKFIKILCRSSRYPNNEKCQICGR